MITNQTYHTMNKLYTLFIGTIKFFTVYGQTLGQSVEWDSQSLIMELSFPEKLILLRGGTGHVL